MTKKQDRRAGGVIEIDALEGRPGRFGLISLAATGDYDNPAIPGFTTPEAQAKYVWIGRASDNKVFNGSSPPDDFDDGYLIQ